MVDSDKQQELGLQMLDMAVLEVVDQDMDIVAIQQVAVDIQEEAPQIVF